MRKNWKQYTAVCMAGGLVMLQLTGCAGKSAQVAKETTSVESSDTAKEAVVENSKDPDAEGGVTVTAQLAEDKVKEVRYLAEDLDAEWDEAAVTGIVLDASGTMVEGDGAHVDGTTVTIEKGGTYVVSGELEDGQIRIEADEDSVVRLVLNGMKLSNKSTAPIYGSEKCKVILTLEAGVENVVSDGTAYQYEDEGEDEPDSPIFTEGDLTINGTGKLEVHGNYQSGIRSKGKVIVASGVISIDAKDDGLKGKDVVIIHDGVLNIKSVKDGIKSNNDADEDKGFVWIDGGDITIAAQDDGIQAETALVVNGGEITISESQEGLAGRTVDILDGLIKANTSDDGINSAASVETEQEKMQDQEGVYTRIAGGEIWLNASADGIDSNGDLYVEGGALYLSGPTGGGDGILDYNGTSTITGGTVFAAGSSGMMQTFGDDSTQNYLVVYYTETQKGGTNVRLLNESGEELGSYTPERDYQAVIISSPNIQSGSTYQVMTGETAVEMAVSGVVTIYGTAPTGGPGGRGGMGRSGGAGRPDGEQIQGGGKRTEREQMPEEGKNHGDMPPKEGTAQENQNGS